MDRKTATVVGAAAALAAGAGMAQAAPPAPAVPAAASYADLLQPIPNAVERLKMSDMEIASRPARLIEAQYYHHHHHHHDNSWYQQRGYVWRGGAWVAPGIGIGFQFAPAPRGDFWYGAPATLDERITWLDRRLDRMGREGRIDRAQWDRDHDSLMSLHQQLGGLRARDGGSLSPQDRDYVVGKLSEIRNHMNWQQSMGY
jgi:hypothetical protein